MKDYLLLFRNDPSLLTNRSEEEIQAITKKWMDWIGSIAAQNKLTDRGNRLFNTGNVVKPNNVVTNGPYTEIKESIGGYTIVKSESYEGAVELTKGCPVFLIGGSVEVREISPM